MVFPTFLHTFKHSAAHRVSHVEGPAAEVSGEEVSELRDLWSHQAGCKIISPGSWSWWHEETGVSELESLHHRAKKLIAMVGLTAATVLLC